jgi:hypothetical protein
MPSGSSTRLIAPLGDNGVGPIVITVEVTITVGAIWPDSIGATVAVGRNVAVAVALGVGETVAVAVAVGLGVEVGTGVKVEVGVSVGVGTLIVTITSKAIPTIVGVSVTVGVILFRPNEKSPFPEQADRQTVRRLISHRQRLLRR